MSDGSLFYVDIEDSAGTRLGPGPITSAVSWSVVRRASKAGTFAFSMPAGDAMATYVTVKRVASIYAMVNNRYQYVGGGIIDRITRTPDPAGRVVLSVGGDDMLRELTYRSVGALKVSTLGMGGPLTHAQAVTAVAALAPSGWTFTADATPPEDGMYGQFAGETVLAAMLEVAKQCRTFAVLSDRRALTFVSSWPASGVRAIAAAGATLTTETCAITALSVEQQSTDLISRVIPVGSGQSAVSLTLRASDRVADAGYTLDTANNYLANTAAEATYGRIERVVNFKDIVPLSNTTADLVSAANQLYESAYYYLSQRVAPVSNYRLTVAECNALVAPGTTIRVAYRNTDAGIDLDRDLYVLEVAWMGDATGARTAQLVVSDAALWVDSDTGAIVDAVKTGGIYQAHSQLNANSYVISYDKGLSYDAPQTFRWRFDEDVLQLARVVFDVRVSALLYSIQTAKTSLVAVWHDTDPGTTSATAVSGTSGTTGVSGTTDNTTIGALTSANNAAPSAKATAANSAPVAKATAAYDYGITVTSGSTNTIAYTGTATPAAISLAGTVSATSISGSTDPTLITNPTDAGGSHTHTVNVGNGTSGTAVYYSGGGLYTSGGGTFVAPASATHTHSLSLTSHGHTLTSVGSHTHPASGITAHTHTVNIGHTHSAAQVLHAHAITVGSHTHNYTETAHTHNYTETQHTHSTTVPAHNHTYNAGTHSHTYNAGTHTHTYAGLDHDHNISTEVRYGVFTADTTANMLAITEIEYSLDGATWYAWTAGVNGYEAFSDWHRVDLTALLIDANLRPLAANNALQVRLKAATPWYKIAQLEAQLSVRNIIQALALT